MKERDEVVNVDMMGCTFLGESSGIRMYGLEDGRLLAVRNEGVKPRESVEMMCTPKPLNVALWPERTELYFAKRDEALPHDLEFKQDLVHPREVRIGGTAICFYVGRGSCSGRWYVWPFDNRGYRLGDE